MHFTTFSLRFSKTNMVLVLFVFVFYSCATQASDGIKTVNIFEAEEGGLTISEIADDITYIPLASDSVLAYIMNVVYFDGEYFVKDNKSKFLRFDGHGNLLNQIGRRGQGPGEYMYTSDFVIHPATSNIYISGGKPEQLMVFSRKGKFLKTIDLTKKYTNSIGISGENLFLFYLDGAEHNEENMDLLDTDGNKIKSYSNKYKFERGRAMMSFSGECATYLLEDKLHFKEIFSDTIFSIDGQNMVPKMILNSEEKRFTPETRKKVSEELGADPREPGASLTNSVTQNNLFETGNFLFYEYGYNKKGRMLIYNKSTGKAVETDSQEGIKNDWDGGPNIQLKMAKDDNTVFAWVNAFELKQYVASDDFKNSVPKHPEKKKELEELANSLDENDNPLLMLVKLKPQ
ncbi:6-bladed beta-propeller [Maribellus maritimus]|uniref:6-bladed beta-propeller n=1 Tax=Maribellus maritimus TaxID=2870838 RepID=UPI001EEBC10D|nr:6-bladed beta-propeller [Maribellus maritimus]MCG6189364.1 6-bladed beta-propeller [Maribellus maritimus]